MQMNVWESGLAKTCLWDDFDLVISKWVHQNIKISFPFPRNVNDEHLKVSSHSWVWPYRTSKIHSESGGRSGSQCGYNYINWHLEKFLKIKLLYTALKIPSKQLHQNNMYMISIYPYKSPRMCQIHVFFLQEGDPICHHTLLFRWAELSLSIAFRLGYSTS